MSLSYNEFVVGTVPVAYWPLEDFARETSAAVTMLCRPAWQYNRNNTTSWMEKTVTFDVNGGAVEVDYWAHHYSAMTGLQILVDGVSQFTSASETRCDGIGGWKKARVHVAAGQRTIRVAFVKDNQNLIHPDISIIKKISFLNASISSDPHRYWRLYIAASNGSSYCGIGEIQLRATSGGADQTGSGTAYASTEFNSSHQAAYAVDNDASTPWASNGSPMPQWWAYDFGAGSEKSIGEVVISARTGGAGEITQAPRDFAIQWSDDGVTWTSIREVTGYTSWTSGSSYTVGTGEYSSFEEQDFSAMTNSIGMSPADWNTGASITNASSWIILSGAPENRLPILPITYPDVTGNGNDLLPYVTNGNGFITDQLLGPFFAQNSTYFYRTYRPRFQAPLSFFDYEYTQPFTIAFWYRWSGGDYNMGFFGKWSGQRGIEICSPSTNTPYQFQTTLADDLGGGSYIQKTWDMTGVASTATWSHFCVTYDGSGTAAGFELYINGTLKVGNTAGSDLTVGNTIRTTAAVQVGAREEGAPSRNSLNGNFSSFVVYDEVISASTRLLLSTGASGAYASSAALDGDLVEMDAVLSSSSRALTNPTSQTIQQGGGIRKHVSKLNPGTN